jgi:hypothetical protein
MLFVEKLDKSPVLALSMIVFIVLACIELVKREKVEMVLGKDVMPPLPDPGGAPLIVQTQRDIALM